MSQSVGTTSDLKYLLQLPEGYGRKEQLWPMILFLHGAGERGDDLELVKKHGPPKLIEEGKDFAFIVVSPQCPKDKWWSNDSLKALLDEIVANYAVDTDRVYLTGMSMGGYGTWSLACEYPECFAAIAPICGGGDAGLAGKLRDVPAWAFHGAKDEVIALEESQKMVDAVNAAGGDARLTVYPRVGHDSWTKSYNNRKLYKWFLKHRKNTDSDR